MAEIVSCQEPGAVNSTEVQARMYVHQYLTRIPPCYSTAVTDGRRTDVGARDDVRSNVTRFATL